VNKDLKVNNLVLSFLQTSIDKETYSGKELSMIVFLKETYLKWVLITVEERKSTSLESVGDVTGGQKTSFNKLVAWVSGKLEINSYNNVNEGSSKVLPFSTDLNIQ
jgi:hypothetical protein